MEQITVVIGDRLGKGQKARRRRWKSGRTCCGRPRVAADSAVFKGHNESGKRHLRHLLCGKGGAGAITAQTKYGYKAKYGMRALLMRARSLSTKAATCWVGLYGIKKSWASGWSKPGKRNTAHKYERAIHHHGEGCRQRRKQITGLRRCPEPCAGCGDEIILAHPTAY